MTAHLVHGPQGRLRVDDGGQGGVPVLFVHGGALDLRGHGESEPPHDGSPSR